VKTYTLSWDSHCLELGNRTCVMGILNVTPDSFSDGGLFFSRDAAVAHGEKLFEDGADIIDVGGESTRPFSEPIAAEEEIRRVIPVIEDLSKRVSVPISVDTTKASVARRAMDAGASIINDIGSLRFDSGMADVAARYQVPLIVMHMRGTPKTMQTMTAYDDLIEEIKTFLQNAIHRAVEKGISKSKIIIDPGIGFGKTIKHNLLIINRLHELQTLDAPILVGASRKSFIKTSLKNEIDKKPDNAFPVIEIGTQAAIAAAVLQGAHIVRVHDVATTRATVKIIDAVIHARKSP
jgi:dihydropteroate synthase